MKIFCVLAGIESEPALEADFIPVWRGSVTKKNVIFLCGLVSAGAYLFLKSAIWILIDCDTLFELFARASNQLLFHLEFSQEKLVIQLSINMNFYQLLDVLDAVLDVKSRQYFFSKASRSW